MTPCKFALIEPFVTTAALKSYADQCEPSHLVGMYNVLERHNQEAEIIDAYSRRMPPKTVADYLRRQRFSHVGISTYDYAPSLAYVQELLENLEPGVVTVLGGAGATYSPSRIAEATRAAWIVRGDGEPALDELVRSNFQPRDMTRNRSLDSWILQSTAVDPNQVDYERPYSLAPYGFEASPCIQRGCVGKCIFCAGAYQRHFAYVAPNRFEKMVEYLTMDQRARILAPTGPDFTAIPPQANDLVEVLVRGDWGLEAFRPGVRLDTLWDAVMAQPELWRNLAAQTVVSFESSIESFSELRLNRLGKNVSGDFLASLPQRLDEILKICPAKIVLGRIALDPIISIEEFIGDCESFIELLSRFPQQVTIGGMLMNSFVPLWGTPCMENGTTNNPWAEPSQYRDPAVAALQAEFLQLPEFSHWCSLAEKMIGFADRNEVFCEILRVTAEKAAQMARRTADSSIVHCGGHGTCHCRARKAQTDALGRTGRNAG